MICDCSHWYLTVYVTLISVTLMILTRSVWLLSHWTPKHRLSGKTKEQQTQTTVSLSVVKRNNILFLSYSKSSKLPGPFLSLSKEICGVW